MDVAVKQSSLEQTKDDREKFLGEARQMRFYSHPNVVKILGVAAFQEPLLIVMELAPGGSLLNRLRTLGNKITSSERIRFCLEAAKGLEYLEKRKCIHR